MKEPSYCLWTSPRAAQHCKPSLRLGKYEAFPTCRAAAGVISFLLTTHCVCVEFTHSISWTVLHIMHVKNLSCIWSCIGNRYTCWLLCGGMQWNSEKQRGSSSLFCSSSEYSTCVYISHTLIQMCIHDNEDTYMYVSRFMWITYVKIHSTLLFPSCVTTKYLQ